MTDHEQGSIPTAAELLAGRDIPTAAEILRGMNQPQPAPDAVAIADLATWAKDALLDARALAAALGVCPRTIRRMVKRRELPPPMRLGGRSRWLAAGVREHIRRECERLARVQKRDADNGKRR